MAKRITNVPARNVLAAATALALWSGEALATVYVTSGGDPDPNRTDTCSLRQALSLTGNCVETDTSQNSRKSIEIVPALANSTITLEHGELYLYTPSSQFDNRVDIQMRGVTIDAHHASRALHFKGHAISSVEPYALMTLTDGRITGGVTVSKNCNYVGCSQPGGGIYVETAALILNRCVVAGNSAVAGGGIFGTGGGSFSWPGIYLYDSTVDGNVADIKGGGVAAYGMRVMTLRSTISNNSAGMYGGGIAASNAPTTANFDNQGKTQLLASTVSGNHVSYCVYLSGNYAVGAGIYSNNTPLVLDGTTISGNHGGCAGAGIDVFTGPQTSIDLRNSIVSGNTTTVSYSTGPSEIANFFYGQSPFNASSSLLGNSLTAGGPHGAGNLYTDMPLLEPLANHGGFTATLRPTASSPAIDHGSDASCAARLNFDFISDQRRVSQPQGAHCDIGAFEVRQGSFAIAASVTGSGRIDALPVPTGSGSSGGIANCTAGGGSSCAATFVGENNDATLTVTSTPAAGWHLASWGGDCVQSDDGATATLTIDAPRTCSAAFAIDSYAIGGFVQGLSGAGLVLQLNGAANLTIAADGRFAFSSPLTYNSAYAVAVAAQPAGQLCVAAAATGTAVHNVDDIAVTCSATPLPAAVTLSIDDGLAFALPGNAPGYTITIVNSGANAVYGAALSTVTSPAGALGTPWWSCGGGCMPLYGHGDVALQLDLPAHSQRVIHLDGVVAAAAPRTFSVAAHIALPTLYTDASGVHAATDTDENPLIFRSSFEVISSP